MKWRFWNSSSNQWLPMSSEGMVQSAIAWGFKIQYSTSGRFWHNFGNSTFGLAEGAD